jgi:hypothetical protein
MCSAIHRNLVPARYESGRKMFCEGFESAIAGWYATGSENGYAHTENFELATEMCASQLTTCMLAAFS